MWVIFALLYPDPDSESRSGSNPDPDTNRIRIRNPAYMYSVVQIIDPDPEDKEDVPHLDEDGLVGDADGALLLEVAWRLHKSSLLTRGIQYFMVNHGIRAKGRSTFAIGESSRGFVQHTIPLAYGSSLLGLGKVFLR